MHWTPVLRRWHKWIAVVVGLQLLAWTTSGLVFTLDPIAVVRGETLLAGPASPTAPVDEVAGPGRYRACDAPGLRKPRACGRCRCRWAELMTRVFLVDVLHCPRCGGWRRILAAITEGRVIRAMLASLGMPTELPSVRPARGPPDVLLLD
jgi:hypothetical protein